MTSAEIAARLLELTKTWDVASLVLGFSGTPMFHVVYAFVGEESPGRLKSLNELSSEISTFIGHGYIPIGLLAWHEYAPQQAQLQTQIFPEYTQNQWARGILEHMFDDMGD